MPRGTQLCAPRNDVLLHNVMLPSAMMFSPSQAPTKVMCRGGTPCPLIRGAKESLSFAPLSFAERTYRIALARYIERELASVYRIERSEIYRVERSEIYRVERSEIYRVERREGGRMN